MNKAGFRKQGAATFRIVLIVALIGLALAVTNTPAYGQDNAGTPVGNHFWLRRPLPANANLRIEFGFPYSTNRNGRSPTHHGVDITNRRGTPVLAAADGTVYFAGDDSAQAFGERPAFYGNLVILAHDFDAPEGGKVFTLYGHLNTVTVTAGTRVAAGDPIGTVGATGIAIGSHLHFEVRIGNPDDYFAVRNPELWLAPLAGTGTLIGRVLNADGSLAGNVRAAVSSAGGVFPSYTYIDPAMRSDPAYGENFAQTDLRAGCYSVRIRGQYDGRVCITAGEATLIEIRLP